LKPNGPTPDTRNLPARRSLEGEGGTPEQNPLGKFIQDGKNYLLGVMRRKGVDLVLRGTPDWQGIKRYFWFLKSGRNWYVSCIFFGYQNCMLRILIVAPN
jgi:hypothetical protein